MAKANAKQAKGGKGRQNGPVAARTAFLFRAMNYLSSHAKLGSPPHSQKTLSSSSKSAAHPDAMVDVETDNQAADGPLEATENNSSVDTSTPSTSLTQAVDIALTSHLGTHLRLVAQKAQLRLSQPVKRSICKRCNCLLTPDTAAVRIENGSKKKARWADVLVLECAVCGVPKRFPVGNDLQPKRRRGRMPKSDDRKKAAGERKKGKNEKETKRQAGQKGKD